MSVDKLHDLRRKRALLVAEMKALAVKDAEDGTDNMAADDATRFDAIEAEITALDARVAKVETAMAMDAGAADEAKMAEDDDKKDKSGIAGVRRGVYAQPREKLAAGIVVGGCIKMLAAGGSIYGARSESAALYGAEHPVTKALVAAVGASGGFIVPPDYVAEIIELLRAQTVVRGSGPRLLGMPRGTMTLPRQSQAASASYAGETSAIAASQPSMDQIVATYKKLTALVPVSNDLMRYADPSADAMVRDDLVAVLARREDLAFIRGDGSAGSPRGFLSFCASSNVITSTAVYTLTTAAQEIGGALNKIETANVPRVNPTWIMHPRSKNYLLNVQNTIGAYVYRDEMNAGTLLGIPFKTTTQIPTNLTVGGNSDCSEVYLVEMSQALLLDSMTLELAVSREATYVDTSGTSVNTFQQDQTLVRAIAEHDFQMRHPEAISIIKGVRWAPAIS